MFMYVVEVIGCIFLLFMLASLAFLIVEAVVFMADRLWHWLVIAASLGGIYWLCKNWTLALYISQGGWGWFLAFGALSLIIYYAFRSAMQRLFPIALDREMKKREVRFSFSTPPSEVTKEQLRQMFLGDDVNFEETTERPEPLSSLPSLPPLPPVPPERSEPPEPR